jgi:uncharacterized membrane protein YqjE
MSPAVSDPSRPGRAGGLGVSLGEFGDSLLRLLETRIEILELEWAEERGNLTRLLLAVVGILICLQIAIVVGLVYLLLVVGEQHRVLTLGAVALALLLGAVGGALGLRRWLRRRPPMFRTTIAELRKDREWIRGRP